MPTFLAWICIFEWYLQSVNILIFEFMLSLENRLEEEKEPKESNEFTLSS